MESSEQNLEWVKKGAKMIFLAEGKARERL
jgi:hypothetical protein